MNTKRFYSMAVVLLVSLFLSFGKAFAAESITSHNADYTINKDGTVSVVDTIVYDFGSEQRHGIIRKMETVKTNQDGDKYKVKFSGFSVTNENGAPYEFTQKKEGTLEVLQIGSADKFVSGQKTYVITYTLSGALTYYSEHDEFYWNVTGNLTEVPVYGSAVRVSLPLELATSPDVRAECFTGIFGSSEKNCSVQVFGNRLAVDLKKSLSPQEGLTVVVGFPKGYVEVLEPEIFKPKEMTLIQKILTFLFTAAITLAVFFWNVFYPIKILVKYFKDKKNTENKQRIVSAWFESPETLGKRSMTPAETGALVDKNVDHKDVSATIIDLAQRGYLKIVTDDKNATSLTKMKEYASDASLLDFEKGILEGLFSGSTDGNVKMSSLAMSPSFYNKVKKAKEDISKRLKSEGFFKDDLLKTELFYMVMGVLAACTFNLILTAVAFIFGRKSARRTDLGIEKYSEGFSLKNFLVSQDAQINFQSKNQMFFEKLLPYATAFGVEKVWAKRFESLKLAKPDWYEGKDFNALALAGVTNRLNSGIRTNNNVMSSTRSSSGFSSGFSGGHSGGGGGGGGTGSW